MENKNKVSVNASTKEILKMLKKSGLVVQVKESKVDDVKSEFDNKAYHNTGLLLKQYRTIKWMIECFPSQIEEELSASFEDFDDLMLKLGIEERAYSNYHISGRAKSLSKSRMILEWVNQSLTVLRKKPKNGDALCDFREQMGMLHSKLYHDKGEVEFFIGGDEKTINEYQTIQEAPEILINVARIMKCMCSKISEYCLQNSWNRKDNWKKYLLEFYIPYEALEMNIDVKRNGYYYDCREWFELVGFSEDDYFDDVVPLSFYHNKHIIENCLSLFFEGEPLIKYGQLLPNYIYPLICFRK